MLTDLAAELLITGAVVEVRSPELGDWSMTMGTRTYQGTDPVQLGDHIRIGSVTKTWTGTVILQLVGEGAIGLDDPVSKYRPDVPNGDAITIRQMLNMSSGLWNYTEAPELNQALDDDPTKVWDPEALVALGLAQPPYFPPGEGFHYSNTNTVLLGLIAEQVTGTPLPQLIRQRILDPTGMTGSLFPETSDNLVPEPHAQGYTYGTNVETLEDSALPADVQEAARNGTLAPMDVTDVNPSWGWSAGAGMSTADDLVKYARALVDGDLLAPAEQQARLDSVVSTDPSNPMAASYGLALAKFGPLYGHTGELPGFNTFVGRDPDRDITVVIWTSLAPTVDGQDPATELAKAVIKVLYAS